jgi:hypothetical protein
LPPVLFKGFGPFHPRYTDLRMTTEQLINAVNSLSPEEQASVAQFIDYLKQRNTPSTQIFLQAADQFMSEHPELLQRLSQ